VTGSTGYIGSALKKELQSKGTSIVTIGSNSDSRSRLIENRENVSVTFAKEEFDNIYHLAAKNDIKKSWSETQNYFETNVVGTYNLLDEAKSYRKSAIPFLFVSSSSVYGNSYPCLIREEFELKPVNPYGLTKACAESICKNYFHTYDLKTKIARPFYVTGFACPKGVISEVARTIATIELGLAKPNISIGNPKAVLDVIDISDCVSALQIILQAGDAAETYNVCTGEGKSVGEIIFMLISKSKEQRIEVTYEANKMRESDQNMLVGDPSKLEQIGWKRTGSIEKTLDDVLLYWRVAMSREHSTGLVRNP
jgi:GDP-4-dehydro-6-deoxy-D-mannose reductase